VVGDNGGDKVGTSCHWVIVRCLGEGLESEELLNRSVSWLVGIPVVAGAEKFIITYNMHARKSTDLQTH